MGAVFRRNWLFAKRNNLVLMGWLVPPACVLFNWLSSLADDDVFGGVGAGVSRLQIFQPYTVVMIYLFVNTLVSWLAATYVALKEGEPGSLDLIKLTGVRPGEVWAGHLATQAAIMLPQIFVFFAGLLIYNELFLAQTPEGMTLRNNLPLFASVILMNVINFLFISSLTLSGIFRLPAAGIALGALFSFLVVPADFMMFWLADFYSVPLALVAGAAAAPAAAVNLFALASGASNWKARRR
ncbi:MAG: hypothetical protein HRF49_08555 [bacterium]